METLIPQRVQLGLILNGISNLVFFCYCSVFDKTYNVRYGSKHKSRRFSSLKISDSSEIFESRSYLKNITYYFY